MNALRRAVLGFAACFALAAQAQSTGLLYDPEPPPNSAYVRVINALPDAKLEVVVDGRSRIGSLESGQASDYLVLAAGKRDLEARAGGKEIGRVSLDVVAGRAISVAFHSRAAPPWIFEDKANTNKLKAVLAVYNLAQDANTIDVVTADGAAKVASGLKPGAFVALPVNPIRVELVATRPGTTNALAGAFVAMAPGGTYTWMLFKGKGGLEARAFQNKVERYTR